MSVSFFSVVCCKVDHYETGRSLFLGSLTECVVPESDLRPE